ncbi:MAG: threonine/serine dehydratase [Anaerolineae bacterium]|nr:threonine/serine dehydratase [Anaerolineae bacterium]
MARTRLENAILRTPLLYSSALSRRTGAHVYLKMECWQLCGCFKVRGAINMVTALTEENRNRGLVTCSSGNHGTALAYAASISGHPPTKVFLPTYADPNKVSKLTALGAEAVLHGDTFLETLDTALQYAEDEGATYVHSHSDPLVIAGQGTIGLELLEDLPDVQSVLVPIGGGGLISGIATAIKAVAPEVRMIGVEPTAAPGAYLSFRDGTCHERIELRPSVADGLLGTLTPLTWQISRDLVDDVLLVEEDEIIGAMQVFQQDEQLMLEGAAAVGLAAILSGKADVQGQKTVLILTGRNIDARQYNRLVGQAGRD